MGLTVTSSTEIPATVYEELKGHLRLSDDTDFGAAMLYLRTAVDDCETCTGRALWNTTYKWTFKDFSGSTTIELPRCPVSSVTSVKYYDTDGVQQTFSSSNYTVGTNDRFNGVIELKDSADWPDVDEDHPEGVEVIFVAGYGTGMADIPQLLLGGLVMYAGHLFDNRNAQAAEDLDKVRFRCFERYRARWYK